MHLIAEFTSITQRADGSRWCARSHFIQTPGYCTASESRGTHSSPKGDLFKLIQEPGGHLAPEQCFVTESRRAESK